MKNLKALLFLVLFIVVNSNMLCQESMDKSFQNFFRNGEIKNLPAYNLTYEIPVYNDEAIPKLDFSLIYPLFKNFELGGKFGYVYVSKLRSGFTDLTLVFKYGLRFQNIYPSFGTYLVFDVGSDVINEGGDSKGIFVSVNYEIDNDLELNIVFNRIVNSSPQYRGKNANGYNISDNSNQLGIELFYGFQKDLGFIFELTSNDYPFSDQHRTLMNLGVNYNVEPIAILRAALGIDLNDSSSKFLTFGVLF